MFSRKRIFSIFIAFILFVIALEINSLTGVNEINKIDDRLRNVFHFNEGRAASMNESYHHIRGVELKNKQNKGIVRPKYTSDEFQQGMNVLIYGHPDMAEAHRVFQHLRKLGVNSVAINFPLYQTDWQGNDVQMNPTITPTIPELTELIERAHAVGLSVMLRPLLDESNLMIANKWRGQIKPNDPNAWFNSYQSLLLTYAELAQTTDVKVLNIGTEFNSLQQLYQNKWIEMINALRQIYDGELMYSFNWDTVQDIPSIKFVQFLDHVGIDAYFPLNVPDGADLETLETAWNKRINKLKKFLDHESIIITEAGIIPVSGAYRTPYKWNIPNGKLDWQAQANYYEATYKAWNASIQGFYWWNVTLDQNQEEISYSPLNSPTENVIKKYFLDKPLNE